MNRLVIGIILFEAILRTEIRWWQAELNALGAGKALGYHIGTTW
jgi:hypothetical protein